MASALAPSPGIGTSIGTDAGVDIGTGITTGTSTEPHPQRRPRLQGLYRHRAHRGPGLPRSPGHRIPTSAQRWRVGVGKGVSPLPALGLCCWHPPSPSSKPPVTPEGRDPHGGEHPATPVPARDGRETHVWGCTGRGGPLCALTPMPGPFWSNSAGAREKKPRYGPAFTETSGEKLLWHRGAPGSVWGPRWGLRSAGHGPGWPQSPGGEGSGTRRVNGLSRRHGSPSSHFARGCHRFPLPRPLHRCVLHLGCP